jgi:hypothetical protein
LPVEGRGYAARLRKTLRVCANRLEVACRMENVGTRPLRVDEYAHNFIGLDQGRIGPGLVVRFPDAVAPEEENEWTANLAVAGRELTWRTVPDRPFFARLAGGARRPGTQWELFRPGGVVPAVRESVDFIPWRVVLWGQRHVVSVEVFIEIVLAPGDARRWMRSYRFEAKAKPKQPSGRKE